MSRREFDTHRPDIDAHVWAVTNAAGDARKRDRLLAVREAGTGELLAELLGTEWGTVLRYRAGRHELNRKMNGYMPLRRGEWALEPLTGDRRQFFETFSRTNIYGLSAGQLLDRLAAGTVEVVKAHAATTPTDGDDAVI